MQEFKEKPGCAYLNAPVPEIIVCQRCGGEIEIWSDEYEKACRCGNIVKKEDVYMPTKLNEKYKCNICGNEVVVVHAGAGTLVCCGKPMQKIG